MFSREALRLDHALGAERAASAASATTLQRANDRIAKLLAEVLDSTTQLGSAQARIRSLESASARANGQRTAETAEYERRIAQIASERDGVEKQAVQRAEAQIKQTEQTHALEMKRAQQSFDESAAVKQRLIDSHKSTVDAIEARHRSELEIARNQSAAAMKATTDAHATEVATVRNQLEAANKTVRDLKSLEHDLAVALQTISERNLSLNELNTRHQNERSKREELERQTASLKADLLMNQKTAATTSAQLTALERARDKSEQTYRDMVSVWNEEKQNRERAQIAENARRQSEGMIRRIDSSYDSSFVVRRSSLDWTAVIRTELVTICCFVFVLCRCVFSRSFEISVSVTARERRGSA